MTDFDWTDAASDEGAVALGEAVAVPKKGEWLIRDGEVVKVLEMDYRNRVDDMDQWLVLTEAEKEDD